TLHPGQRLVIPRYKPSRVATTPPPRPAVPTPAPAASPAGNANVHVVAAGHTLSKISPPYHKSVHENAKAHHLPPTPPLKVRRPPAHSGRAGTGGEGQRSSGRRASKAGGSGGAEGSRAGAERKRRRADGSARQGGREIGGRDRRGAEVSLAGEWPRDRQLRPH